MTVRGSGLLGLTQEAGLSVIGFSTWSNMSMREGVIYRRVDPHSALQSIPKPLGLRDSATLWESCCNHSLPPLPPSFMERQMDEAEKPAEQQACWVASSQTVYTPQQSRFRNLHILCRSRQHNTLGGGYCYSTRGLPVSTQKVISCPLTALFPITSFIPQQFANTSHFYALGKRRHYNESAV